LLSCVLDLSVSRGSTNGQTTTFLRFFTFATDPNDPSGAYSYTDGSGIIPNNALQVHGTTTSLDLDLSTVPGFQSESCVPDPSAPGLFICTPAQGLVSGSWNVIPSFTARTSETQHSFRVGPAVPYSFQFLRTGTANGRPAIVNITVLGTSGSNMGFVGTTHDTTITVFK